MKAVSKIVASIIIINIVIAVSLAIALLLSGAVSEKTRYERLDIISSYAVIVSDKEGNQTYYLIVLEVFNRGSIDTVIDRVLLNGKPLENYGDSASIIEPQLPYKLVAGNTTKIYVRLSIDSFSHGQMIQVEIHTYSGINYPTYVILP